MTRGLGTPRCNKKQWSEKGMEDPKRPPAVMGAGTGGAGWASAHPGKNQGGPWKF